MSKRMEIKVIEISGFVSAFETLRRPYKLDVRSLNDFNYDYTGNLIFTNSSVIINNKDVALMSRLVKNGDEEAKAIRAINATLSIQAPRWWWVEMDTYDVGVIKLCGESTMHTDCKGMMGEELMEYKDNMSQGMLERRDRMFSYQTLRRIYKQRKDHRLDIWREFCDFIVTLPLSKELITIGCSNN